MKAIRLARSAVLGGVVALALSCRDAGPLGVTPSAADLLAPPTHVGLMRCMPVPADSVTQTIGPEGGVLAVGPHTLLIPPGALALPVTITAVAPSDTVNRVVFTPEGLSFDQSPTLTLSYANCRGLSLGWPKRIAYTNDVLAILEYLLSIDNPLARRVSAPIGHFSTYAVAW